MLFDINKSFPLLQDFSTFTKFVIDQKVTLSSDNEYISRNFCFALNQKLIEKATAVTPRSPQTRYPMIHLCYHIALASKLLIKRPVSEKKLQLALVPTERLALYEQLTPVEQYFFLLETFWVETRWSYLQAKAFFPEPSEIVPDVLAVLDNATPDEPIKLKAGDKYVGKGKLFEMLNYFLLYFAYFGFWSVELDPQPDFIDSKHHIKPKKLTPTLLGNKFAFILRRERHLWFWNKPNRRESQENNPIPGSPLPETSVHIEFPKKFGVKIADHLSLHAGKPGPFFKPFALLFPKDSLRKTLPDLTMSYQKGVYKVLVSLEKDVWRSIELSSEHTLEDLHLEIQEAYHFDNDHLYSFFMDNRRWSRDEEFSSPNADQGVNADEIRIGELDLFVGKQFLYLFDYGDEWVFHILVQDIRITQGLPKNPQILMSHGKSPEQYG